MKQGEKTSTSTRTGDALRRTAVRFQTPVGSFHGWLHDGTIVQRLLECAPIDTTVNRWGEEIYFDVPVKMANTRPTCDVDVGDIAYWPDGPCLCIFFGKTPASRSNEPRPASDVTIIGHTDAPAEHLRQVKAGTTITLTVS
ncbi:MAG: hypothetical protein HYZ89_02960 [Candidatus Omnitrophica bacterium]|nr:hypothetical protein [Candidatus Omnitrophota bacterium]